MHRIILAARRLVGRTSVTASAIVFDVLLIAGLLVFFSVEQRLEFDGLVEDARSLLKLQAQDVGTYADRVFAKLVTALDDLAATTDDAQGLAGTLPADGKRTFVDRVRLMPEVLAAGVIDHRRFRTLYRTEGDAIDPSALERVAQRAHFTSASNVAVDELPALGAGAFLVTRSLGAIADAVSRVFIVVRLDPQALVHPIMFLDVAPRAGIRLAKRALEERGVAVTSSHGAAGSGPLVTDFGMSDEPRSEAGGSGRMLVVVSASHHSPFVAAVSLAEDGLADHWRLHIYRASLLLAGAVLLILMVTMPMKLLIARPVALLGRTIEQIARGNLDGQVPRPLAFADIAKAADGAEVMRRSLRLLTFNLNQEVDRKTGELSLRNEQLNLAITTMAHGLLMLDRHGCVLLWNQRLLEKLGLPSGMIRENVSFKAVVRHLRRRRPLPVVWQQALGLIAEMTGRAEPCSFTLLLPDDCAIEVAHWPVALGSVSTFVDVTEKQRSYRRLLTVAIKARRANDAKVQFLANMSHELRTPLNAILGFSEVLEKQAFGPVGQARYVEYASSIHQSAEHLLSLINDILETARIDAGSERLCEELIDLGDILRWIRDQLELAVGRAGIDLKVTMPERPLPLWADQTRLRQAILNIVGNAVKFTPEGGQVVVTSQVDLSGDVEITVRDSGIGIPAKDLRRVQQRFEQVDGSVSRRFQGAGLGLPLAKGFVELHGGQFLLDSVEGEGTVVTVRLPSERLRQQMGTRDPTAH